MRAYLLGYNHGTNDGYFSTLIEQGGCEAKYDESLDVEYVAIDEVLEIIGEIGNPYEGDAWTFAAVEDTKESFKQAVLALKGEQE